MHSNILRVDIFCFLIINQEYLITERACGARVCSRAQVMLRARDSSAWSRVQAAAHNPRSAATVPLRTRLVAFLKALEKRWKCVSFCIYNFYLYSAFVFVSKSWYSNFNK